MGENNEVAQASLNDIAQTMRSINSFMRVYSSDKQKENHRFVEIENDVKHLLFEVPITSYQAKEIQKAVKSKVREKIEEAGIDYKKYSGVYFSHLWNSLKDHFGCGADYRSTPKGEFVRVINGISEINFNHQMLINKVN